MNAHAIARLVFAAGVGAVLLPGQEAATAMLRLRVVNVAADGKVVVDRGTRDLLHIGDRVELVPADGNRLTATVVQVQDRSAVLELAGGVAAPPVGTKGEVRIPRARIPAAAPAPAPAAAPTPQPTPPPTAPALPPAEPSRPARADGWQPGMPLLAAVPPLRPEQRTPTVSGRVFSVLGVTGNTADDGFEPFARVGTDLDADNPLELGGTFHLDAEIDYRRMQDDSQRGALLIRRLSYSRGGDRFDRDRYEFGRFLHQGFAELGVVDGAQWSRRLDDGSHLGASLGFLPVPDDEYASFADLQFAAFGEWVVDTEATTRIGAALQKTWHNGRSDRDAILLSLHQTPIDGWQVHGTAHIDFYFGDDDQKGRGVELTTGMLTFGRRFEATGFDLGVRRTRYPELLRHEFRLLPPDQLVDERYDRLTLDTYAVLPAGDRPYAHLAGFDDEERTGGAAELGVAMPERFGSGSIVDLAAFGGRGQFERLFGGRLAVSQLLAAGHWQVLYEIGWHRLDDRASDGNDLVQHRLALSIDRRTASGWVLAVTGDAVLWDDELGWSLQFTMHKNF